MNANHIYEERKSASLIIYEFLMKINKKLNYLGILDKEEIKYLKKNIDENNISIRDMNLVLKIINNIKNNIRLMIFLKENDEEFYNEFNIKYSYIYFYNKMFYFDIEYLIVKKIEVFNSNNKIDI